MKSNIAKFGNHPGIATICYYFDKNFTFFKEIEIGETKIKKLKILKLRKDRYPVIFPLR